MTYEHDYDSPVPTAEELSNAVIRKEKHRACGGYAQVKELKSPISKAIADCRKCGMWWTTSIRPDGDVR